MEDDKLQGSQIVKLMDQWMLPMWAITESILDDNDPLKQIADVRRVSHSEYEIEIKIVFQNRFLMSVFESLTQDDQSRFNFQVSKAFTVKFVDAVLAEADAYQEKYNSFLPTISRDAIHKDLAAWLELAGYLAIGAGLAKMDMQDYSEYPNHIIAYLAMVSAYREDRDGFLEFVRKDLNLPESRLAYVWEKLYTFFQESPDRIRNKIDPEKIFNHLRRSVKRAFYQYKRKREKDPILRKIEDKLRGKGEKGIDELFAEIFPFEQVPEDKYEKIGKLANEEYQAFQTEYQQLNETYNSFEDIGRLEEIITINQTCKKLKGVKPERVEDLKELLIIRAVYELSYSEAGSPE
jgi:hypothetical protein